MGTQVTNYRRLEKRDRVWAQSFIREHWGTEQVVVHNCVYLPCEMEGFLAENEDEKSGLITYLIKGKSCELVTVNSTIEHKGIGRMLVALVIKEAMSKKCNKVWLVTTNDNISAIEFYQRIGFQLVKVYPDAVENSRKVKPEIPLIAENGIPIRDELEFVLHF